jgi:hypothetical protein
MTRKDLRRRQRAASYFLYLPSVARTSGTTPGGRVGFVVRDLEPFAHCSSNIFLPHSSSARLPYTKFPPARCASFAIVSIGQPTLIWRAEDSSVIETDAWLTGGNYVTWSRMSRRLASEFRGRTAT